MLARRKTPRARQAQMFDLGSMKKSIRLAHSIGELQELYDKADAFLKDLSTEDQQVLLLILERIVLEQARHRATIKFGKNHYDGEHCSVCRVPLEQEGQQFIVISRWENTVMDFFLCDTCAQSRFEVDVDVLTGRPLSKIGLP